MAKFIVETSQVSRFTYEVEADSMGQAAEKALSANCEPTAEQHESEEVNHAFERRTL